MNKSNHNCPDILGVRVLELEEILSLTDQGILLLSTGGKIEFVNATYYKIMGIPISVQPTIQHLSDFRDAFRKYSPFSFQLRENDEKWESFLQQLDSRNLDAGVSSQTFAMGDKTIKYIRRPFSGNKTLECIFDITKISRQQEQLKIEREKADLAAQAKAEFLANMSHEIRTPMNGIMGMADLLQNRNLENKEREMLSVIQRCAKSLLVLITDILDFSKIESGEMVLDASPFNLVDSIKDIVTLLRTVKTQDDVKLAFTCQSDLPRNFVGDEGRIRQIITNLLGNALKFTNQGEVKISVTGLVDGNDADLYIKIIDTGIGIPPNKIDTIFKEFQQADGSTTRKYGGTGLGLSIARSLTQMMSGRLDVESTLGAGSVFTLSIKLPIQK